jgi:hypothetical protein
MMNVQESENRILKNVEKLDTFNDLLRHLEITANLDLIEESKSDIVSKLQSANARDDWTLVNKGKKPNFVLIQGSGPLNETLNKIYDQEQARLWRNISLGQLLQLIITKEQRLAQLQAFESQLIEANLPQDFDPNGVLLTLKDRSKAFFRQQELKSQHLKFVDQVLMTIPTQHRPKSTLSPQKEDKKTVLKAPKKKEATRQARTDSTATKPPAKTSTDFPKSKEVRRGRCRSPRGSTNSSKRAQNGKNNRSNRSKPPLTRSRISKN